MEEMVNNTQWKYSVHAINRIIPAETQSLGFQITFSWSQVVKTGPTYIAQECISQLDQCRYI